MEYPIEKVENIDIVDQSPPQPNNPPEEELTYTSLLLNSLKEGLPNSLLQADYYIMMFVIKSCLTLIEDTEMASASSFFTVYYSLFLHTAIFSLTDAQGNLGSKALGAKNYNIMCLRLKQSLFIGLLIMLTIGLIPSFFYSDVLRKLCGVEQEISEISQKMVMWALPAMTLRTFNDNFKTFLQNNNKSRELGYKYLFLYIIFIFVAYFLIVILKIREPSAGIVLFLFEMTGLIFSIYEISKFSKTEIFDMSAPLFSKINEFIFLFFDLFIIDAPPCFVFEVQNYIVIMTEINEEIAAYSLCSSLAYLIYYVSIGFSIDVRTIMNKNIGSKNLKKVRTDLLWFKRNYLVLSSIFCLLILGFLWVNEIFGVYGGEGNMIRENMRILKYIWLVKAWNVVYLSMLFTVLKAAELISLMKNFYSYPYLLIGFGSYIFGIYLGYGVIGVLGFETLLMSGIIWTLDVFLGEEWYLGSVKELIKSKELKVSIREEGEV